MFTSFITIHQDNEPVLINIADISFIRDNNLYLRSMETGFACDESFAELNNKIAEELND
jgi:hypothetical protein